MIISKERIAAAFACIMLPMLMQLKMLSSVPDKVKAIYDQEQKVIIAPDSLANPEIRPDAVFDRTLSNSWKIQFTHYTGTDSRSHLPDEKSTYIQMELSLTHFPGNPPILNPLKKLILWPGNYDEGSFTRNYARPSKIRLIFFKQELVDVDREFRLSDPPSYIAERIILLPDAEGPQSIDLDFLPSFMDSKIFPENIFQIWVRIEILDIYHGKKFADKISIAEIDYFNARSEHLQFQASQDSITAEKENSSIKK